MGVLSHRYHSESEAVSVDVFNETQKNHAAVSRPDDYSRALTHRDHTERPGRISTESRCHGPTQRLIHGFCSGRASLPHPFNLWSRVAQTFARRQPPDPLALSAIGEKESQGRRSPPCAKSSKPGVRNAISATNLCLEACTSTRAHTCQSLSKGGETGVLQKSRKVHSRERPRTSYGQSQRCLSSPPTWLAARLTLGRRLGTRGPPLERAHCSGGRSPDFGYVTVSFVFYVWRLDNETEDS